MCPPTQWVGAIPTSGGRYNPATCHSRSCPDHSPARPATHLQASQPAAGLQQLRTAPQRILDVRQQLSPVGCSCRCCCCFCGGLGACCCLLLLLPHPPRPGPRGLVALARPPRRRRRCLCGAPPAAAAAGRAAAIAATAAAGQVLQCLQNQGDLAHKSGDRPANVETNSQANGVKCNVTVFRGQQAGGWQAHQPARRQTAASAAHHAAAALLRWHSWSQISGSGSGSGTRTCSPSGRSARCARWLRCCGTATPRLPQAAL